jgi:hypothetical protein
MFEAKGTYLSFGVSGDQAVGEICTMPPLSEWK